MQTRIRQPPQVRCHDRHRTPEECEWRRLHPGVLDGQQLRYAALRRGPQNLDWIEPPFFRMQPRKLGAAYDFAPVLAKPDPLLRGGSHDPLPLLRSIQSLTGKRARSVNRLSAARMTAI